MVATFSVAMVTNSFGTQRDEFVRLIVCDKHAVVALQLLIADRRLDAEHVVGIALSSNDVAGLDVAELGVGKAEELGDPARGTVLPADAPRRRLWRYGRDLQARPRAACGCP